MYTFSLTGIITYYEIHVYLAERDAGKRCIVGKITYCIQLSIEGACLATIIRTPAACLLVFKFLGSVTYLFNCFSVSILFGREFIFVK